MNWKMTEKEVQKIDAEIAKLIAETALINTTNQKLKREIFWYPMAMSSALILAIGTIIKYIN